MKPFETNWWWRGGNTPMLDRREIIGITPLSYTLEGEEACFVHLRGGHALYMVGTTEYVQSQIYGRWPPDAPEEVDPVPSGTKQPLETMNVSGRALAEDIQAAWEEAWAKSPNAEFSSGAFNAMRLLCIRLGIEVDFRFMPGGDGAKKG